MRLKRVFKNIIWNLLKAGNDAFKYEKKKKMKQRYWDLQTTIGGESECAWFDVKCLELLMLMMKSESEPLLPTESNFITSSREIYKSATPLVEKARTHTWAQRLLFTHHFSFFIRTRWIQTNNR